MLLKKIKWMDLLTHIEDNNLYRVSMSIDCTYTHCSKLLKEFYEMGWVTKKKNPKNKRENIMRLTQKGKEIELAALKINNELKKYEKKFDKNIKS